MNDVWIDSQPIVHCVWLSWQKLMKIEDGILLFSLSIDRKTFAFRSLFDSNIIWNRRNFNYTYLKISQKHSFLLDRRHCDCCVRRKKRTIASPFQSLFAVFFSFSYRVARSNRNCMAMKKNLKIIRFMIETNWLDWLLRHPFSKQNHKFYHFFPDLRASFCRHCSLCVCSVYILLCI